MSEWVKMDELENAIYRLRRKDVFGVVVVCFDDVEALVSGELETLTGEQVAHEEGLL